MKRLARGAAVALALALPEAALAAPGMADEVYSATVEKGEIEFEAIYGRIGGRQDSGTDALRLEGAYSPNAHLRLAAFTKLERDPRATRRATEVGVEAVWALGRPGGIDVAAYAELTHGLNGNSDALEAKLLLERRAGPFDARLNLIAEKPLEHGGPVEFGYAASADVAVIGELRAGVEGLGELGTSAHFLPRAAHVVGPVLKTEIESGGHEIKLSAGYLAALGEARDTSRGQLRLMLDLEF